MRELKQIAGIIDHHTGKEKTLLHWKTHEYCNTETSIGLG